MHEPLSPNPYLQSYGKRLASSPALLWAAPALLLLAGVAIWFLLLREPAREEPVQALVVEPPPVVAVEPDPVPQFVETPAEIPAPPPEPSVPLPALADSDAELASALTESVGARIVEQYLRPENFVRNLVVTIDNFPRTSLALDRRPIQATPGVFVVRGPEEALFLSDENHSRYSPFTALLARTDARTIVALYRRYYPLMQEAYIELGNPDIVFNSRVIEVIDHLLATPEIKGPIPLVQPNVLYQFKDAATEKLSSGQKILLRMGPAHAAIVKTKLREIRAELAAAG
jgi:hypothetical protein